MFQKKQFSFKESYKNNFPNIFHWYLVFLIVLTAFVFLMVCEPLLPQEAQKQEEKKFIITFKSRKFIPKAGIEKKVLSKFKKIITQEKKMPHIIIQFKKTPSRKEREYLKARGISLLSPIGGNAWLSALSDKNTLLFMTPEVVDNYPILGLIRSIGEILPEDKIDIKIFKYGIGLYAKNPDGTVNIIVKFFKDVSERQASRILKKYGSNIEDPGMLNDWRVTVKEEDIKKIASEDEVQYIEEVPPPDKIHNDCSRLCANANPLQVAPYNLDGNNVQAGEWDGGEIGNHVDLAGRVTIIETGNVSNHATHVAGILAGDGTQSATEGGTPNQWRGVATQVDLFSYTFLGGDLEPEEHDDAINVEGIDISQNSWGLDLWDVCPPTCPVSVPNDHALYGNYRGRTKKYDDIVTGEYGTRIPIVFSAGNDQSNVTGSYGSITPPGGTAKNTITVGSINCDDSSMTGTSSWGPTDDGRIKPDIVAPGCERGGDMGVNSTIPNDLYNTMCGTSMAAPVVSGTIALMLQQYRTTFFDSDNVDDAPLPSTFKALLIHSAQNLGNPGPDFQFGYGLIDAQAAVDIIRARDRVIESQISEEEEEDIFRCDVPIGETDFNVALVWDDASATVGAADILVNDLDLELEDPNGNIHEPWILDPANPGNNATTGKDHTNNVEQVHVNNPVSGLWRIRIVGHEIDEPIQKYSLVSDFSFYEIDSVSVVQVIDRTGSMRHRDEPSAPSYMESAKIAAQNFIGLMKIGDEVGVVAFDDEGCNNTGTKAEARFNLVEITNETVRNNAISSIDPLNYRGCTSIGAGMQLAQEGPNFLEIATADQPHAMVLLTDGFQNTAPLVSGILPNIPAKTDIYTIALGSRSDSDLMKDIADTTGAKFYESPTILGLLSVYYQIQGDLQYTELAVLETGSKGSGNDTRVVTIDQGTSEATFVIGWLQTKGDLKLKLINPNEETITVNGPNVKEGHGPTYYFLRIKDPLPGNWEVHILRTDSGTFQVDYTFTVFIKGASKLWSFIPDFTLTGDCLMTKVKLYDNLTLEPIIGASIKAIISSPKTYKYTMNFNYVKPRESKWRPPLVISPDLELTTFADPAAIGDKSPTWASTLLYYDQKSRQETGESIFQYDITEVVLFDDGTQGDEQAGDGTYTNCIDKTQIAGSYNIRFSISGVTPAGANFTRKMLSTASIKPSDVDLVKTLVRVDPYVIDVKKGSAGIITIVPLDRCGNVWGPHFASRISVSATAGELSGELRDNGDGFYFQIIKSTGVEGKGEVIVIIDGVEIETRPVVFFKEKKYPFSFSIHFGLATPKDSFANDFDPGINALLNLDYHFSPQLSLVALLGYNAFKSKTAGVEDTYWINLSANMKYRSHTGALSPYVNGGLGYYIPKTGSSGFGINLGGGLNYDYNNFLTFEVGADYHKVFNKDVQFLHGHAGVIFRF